MPDTLTDKTCHECGKPVLVCEYTPHDLAAEATGIAANYRYDDEDGNSFAGWICLECAWKSANEKGGGTLAGGGPIGEWEFRY